MVTYMVRRSNGRFSSRRVYPRARSPATPAQAQCMSPVEVQCMCRWGSAAYREPKQTVRVCVCVEKSKGVLHNVEIESFYSNGKITFQTECVGKVAKYKWLMQ